MQSLSENIIVDKATVQADEAKIRLLNAADIPEAMSLKEQAGWNQTERDWLRLLELEPDGCFGAIVGNKLAGTITTTTYGKKLAWIGMVLVDPEYRRRKIATRLMTTALDYLDNLNIETVKLDATKEGCYVYENLGFETESMIERWSGIAAEKIAFECSPLSISDLTKLHKTDRLRFGADRSKLIEKLLEDSYRPPLLKVAQDGHLAGYAFIRRGAKATYFGPVIAEAEKTAKSLIDKSLGLVAGETVYIDVNTKFNGFEKILTDRGFARQRELVRMSRGGKNNAATTSEIFAIAGLELG